MEQLSKIVEPVVIDVTSRNGSAPPYRLKGTIQHHANKRLILATDQQIALESDIRTQAKDLLFMGQVLSCEQTPGATTWDIHVNLKRTILVI